jgi:hypothetical protein
MGSQTSHVSTYRELASGPSTGPSAETIQILNASETDLRVAEITTGALWVGFPTGYPGSHDTQDSKLNEDITPICVQCRFVGLDEIFSVSKQAFLAIRETLATNADFRIKTCAIWPGDNNKKPASKTYKLRVIYLVTMVRVVGHGASHTTTQTV